MDPIAFDTETELIRPGLHAPPLVCMSFCEKDDVGLLHHSESRPKFVEMLESGRVLVGHNVAYDMVVMGAKWPELLPRIFETYEEGRVTDTMLRQKLIDIAEGKYRRFIRAGGETVKVGYGLDDLCLRHLGYELPKGEIRLRFGELKDLPVREWPQLAQDYALTDAAVTSAVYDVQEKEGRWSRYLLDQYRQAAAAWWIQLMSVWGIRTDAVGVKQFAAELQTDFDRVSKLLKQVGLMRANGVRDTKAAQEHMRKVCAKKGLGLVLTSPSKRFLEGQVSLSADHCEATGDEVLEAYAKVSSLKKQLSTDIPLLEQGTVMPIHAHFESIVETGRTSSSPNLQNLPVKGKMRECFVPREGRVYAAADYSGFELRTMAQVCISKFRVSKLAEALNAGLDPHLVVAGKILKIPYEKTKELFEAGDDEAYRARQVGKISNFGMPGGLGAERLVVYAKKNYDVTLTEDEAKKLKQDWLEAWPEFRTYFAAIAEICDFPAPQIVHQGSNRFRGDVTFCETANSYFQGLAADAAKAAGFFIAKACYAEPTSVLYGSRIVNFVHDEFILETPEQGAADAAEELARLMVLGASKFLPDVPPLAEPLLMRRWSKKAKAVRDTNGRLVPWAA